MIQLVDAKVGATPLDVEAAEYFAGLGVATTVVATKIDKVKSGRRTAQAREIRAALGMAPDEPMVLFSSRTGEGSQELWRDIREAVDTAVSLETSGELDGETS